MISASFTCGFFNIVTVLRIFNRYPRPWHYCSASASRTNAVYFESMEPNLKRQQQHQSDVWQHTAVISGHNSRNEWDYSSFVLLWRQLSTRAMAETAVAGEQLCALAVPSLCANVRQYGEISQLLDYLWHWKPAVGNSLSILAIKSLNSFGI